MEPANLNQSPEERRLREQLRLPKLPDEGFSARVLAALPARATPALPRWVFIVGGATLGCAIAYDQIGSWSGLATELERSRLFLAPPAIDLASPAIWIGAAVAAVSVAYALVFTEPRRH